MHPLMLIKYIFDYETGQFHETPIKLRTLTAYAKSAFLLLRVFTLTLRAAVGRRWIVAISRSHLISGATSLGATVPGTPFAPTTVHGC